MELLLPYFKNLCCVSYLKIRKLETSPLTLNPMGNLCFKSKTTLSA